MTTGCATLDEYAATAPTEIKPLMIVVDHAEEDRLRLLRSMGLRADPRGSERSVAILAAGFRPCSPQHAVTLMDPMTLGVDTFDGTIDTSAGFDVHQACGFWPGIDHASFGIGDDEFTRDSVVPMRVTFRAPERRGWFHRRDAAKPDAWYLLGALRGLVEPIPYGVALRLKEVVDARIFDRLAVVARCDQFERVVGGDPVILGGARNSAARPSGGMLPHDWFFVALWK